MHAREQCFDELFTVELILDKTTAFAFGDDVEVAIFLCIFALRDDDVLRLHHLQIHR